MMQGHDFDGKALPDVPTGSVIVGSGGLYSTPGNILRWLQWHLDRFSQDGARNGCLTTQLISGETGSTRFSAWMNRATWMQWAWAG